MKVWIVTEHHSLAHHIEAYLNREDAEACVALDHLHVDRKRPRHIELLKVRESGPQAVNVYWASCVVVIESGDIVREQTGREVEVASDRSISVAQLASGGDRREGLLAIRVEGTDEEAVNSLLAQQTAKQLEAARSKAEEE